MDETYFNAGKSDAYRLNEKLTPDFFVDNDKWEAYSIGYDLARDAIDGQIH